MKEAPPSPDPPLLIGAFQAKAELSRLLRQTRAGRRFIITQRGQPVAELRPVDMPPARSGWGDMAGRIRLADDFGAELADLREYME